MKQDAANIVGFLVAPLVAAALCVLQTPLVRPGDMASWLGFLLVFYPFALVATLTLAVPIFLLLHRLEKIRWWSCLVAGMAVGLLVSIVLRLPDMVELRDLISTVPIGAVSASSFWLIWRQGRDEPSVAGDQ